jgi:hypothetical protein
LNLFLISADSSGAVPFGTMLSVVLLWFGINAPLTVAGGLFGKKHGVCSSCYQGRTNRQNNTFRGSDIPFEWIKSQGRFPQAQSICGRGWVLIHWMLLVTDNPLACCVAQRNLTFWSVMMNSRIRINSIYFQALLSLSFISFSRAFLHHAYTMHLVSLHWQLVRWFIMILFEPIQYFEIGVVTLTTGTVTILFTYFILCAEEYRWHWRAFLVCRFTAR